ncbi:hypothetical protein DSO57_1036806 [Entomophthora muscae]|uniref:Uncharacterized protein n=1 Tax=Entomophthora muscae TaxID=34485 RepID=A0ACC2SNJ7_9FUNG|nr:hypothetical protein DSO57_1036806 [Entomophthora muscae]
MARSLFSYCAQFVPSWLYAAILIRLYRFEASVYAFKITKLVFRILSGTSELERICHPDQANSIEISYIERRDKYNDAGGASSPQLKSIKGDPLTLLLVDWSISHSTKLLVERRMLDSGYADISLVTKNILKKKEFPAMGSTETLEASILHDTLGPIVGSRFLEKEMNELSNTKYDATNKRHEQKLLELWNALKPNEPLKDRISLQWESIGFQGRDPASDFRGMGILGLEDLLYFSKTYSEVARAVLERSNHPTSWYSFALAGIHITAYSLELLRTRLLQMQLFQHGVSRTTCQEIYCFLFVQFDAFWFSREVAPTVMDFEILFSQFRNQIRHRLFQLRPLPLPTRLKLKAA